MTEQRALETEAQLLAATRAMLDDWVRRGEGAIERCLAHFTPDTVGIGTGPNEVAIGLENLRALLQREHDNAPPYTCYLSGERAQCLTDTVGLVHGTLTMHMPLEAAEVLTLALRLVCVFKQVDDRWLIAHFGVSRPDPEQAEGESFPVDALRARNQELERLVAERTADLRAAQAQLVHQEKMASLGALTAGIAHEIKNPLNFINNFAALTRELVGELEEETDPEEIEALLADLALNAAKIEEHGKRADGIVRAMMQHARGGSRERETVDLNALVAEYVDLAYHGKRAQTPDFNAEIEEDLDAAVGKVEVVPQEIGRVLLNLIGNAFDAVYEQAARVNGQYVPTVTVSTRRVGEAVEIRVEDNGPGIAEDVRAKIFEPFFTTKPTGSGTGLGLSLSYDIVTQGHGGALTVEREAGQGVAFVVTLPAT